MRRQVPTTIHTFSIRSFQFALLISLLVLSAAVFSLRQAAALARAAQINQTPLVTVSAASFELAALAPGSIAAAFGTQLATRTEGANSLPLPTNLAGTTVRVRDSAGVERTATLFFVSAGQVNFVMPDDTAAGTANLTIQSGDGTTSQGTVEINTVAPAIFTANSDGKGAPAAVLLRNRANGTQVFEEVSEFDATLGIRKPRAIDLTPEGDQVFLVAFLTGIRRAPDANNDGNKQESVHLLLGGTEFTPQFVGAQGTLAGLDQLNLELPRSLIGRGRVSLSIIGPGVSSNLTEIEFGSAAGNAPPAISGFGSANALAGQTLVINGNGFSSNPTDNLVRIGNAEALVTAASATQLTVIVPFGAESGKVSVRTNQGEGQSNNSLQVRTSLSGFVETTTRQPLSGATVKIVSGGRTVMAQTGNNGSFVLPDLASGLATLEVDGTSIAITPPFTRIRQLVVINANRDNPMMRPIALQQVSGSSSSSAQVGGSGLAPHADEMISLSIPTYAAPDDTAQTPGLQTGDVMFQVPANSPVRFPDGATSGIITLTQVENSRTPTALPTGVFSSTIVQITPFNVQLLQGGKFSFPNTDGFPAGTQVKLFRLDQNPESGTLGQFIAAGTATVTNDGQRIETAPNAVTVTSYYFVALTRPTTTVVGRVLDADRTPVRFATVRTRGQEGFTDGSGGFILRNVPVEASGTSLTVEASLARANGRVDRAQSASVRAVPGGITVAGEIVLPAANSNQPPVVLIPSEISVNVGETRDFPFIARDPDGSLPIQLALVGLRFASVVQNPGPAIRLAPSANDVGVYMILLTARDSEGAVTQISLRITVLGSNNRRPVLTVPGAQTVNAGQALNFTVSATDADAGQTLTYTASNLPSGASFNAATRQFSWTPTAAQVGTHTVTFTVTDNGTPPLSDSKQVTINVVDNAGTVRGTVRNAVTGQPLPGATVALTGTNLTTTSASDGAYMLSNVPPRTYTLTAAASGFVSTQVQITVVAGQTLTQNISLSTALATGQLRITLNWTKDGNGAPDDLDAHLFGPAGNSQCFHVFWNNPGSLTASPFAALEVDNVDPRLPDHPPTETVRIAQQTPGLYRFFIHNYGGEQADGISRSRATVQIFRGSELLRSYTVPSGAGEFWHVFDLNSQTGALTDINRLADEPPTFTCGSGCAYSINPTSQSFAASGGAGSVNVTTQANCAWTATSNANWLTLTSGASGNGNGTVNYSVAANTGGARTGTLTIAGQTFTVTQAGSGALNITDRRISAGPIPAQCSPPAVKTTFLTSDEIAYQWMSFSNGAQGDEVRWDFIQPNGQVFKTTNYRLEFAGGGCVWAPLEIADSDVAGLPGAWQVRVFYKGTQVLSDNFTINRGSVNLLDHRLTPGPISGCTPPTAKTAYLTTDAQVIQWTLLSGASAGDTGRWEFVRPDGTLHLTSNLPALTLSGRVCLRSGAMPIANASAASFPGTWQVRLFYRDALLVTDTFTLTRASTTAPPPTPTADNRAEQTGPTGRAAAVVSTRLQAHGAAGLGRRAKLKAAFR